MTECTGYSSLKSCVLMVFLLPRFISFISAFLWFPTPFSSMGLLLNPSNRVVACGRAIPCPLTCSYFAWIFYPVWHPWQLISRVLTAKNALGGAPRFLTCSLPMTMFFIRTSEEACLSLKSLIDRFCAISGQMLNLQKSLIKFSPNIAINLQLRYKEIFRMEAQESLGSYLGVNIDITGSKIWHFTPLLDSMSTRISQWQSKGLS